MDNQTKIKILKDYINIKEKNSSHLTLINSDLYRESKNWLQELEQSNNIDSWSNKDLFAYCVENGLFNKEQSALDFDIWDNQIGRNEMIEIISHHKAK